MKVQCGYCEFENANTEVRCRRCGRRLLTTSSPTNSAQHDGTPMGNVAVRTLGATVLAARMEPLVTNAIPPHSHTEERAESPLGQGILFADGKSSRANVVPILSPRNRVRHPESVRTAVVRASVDGIAPHLNEEPAAMPRLSQPAPRKEAGRPTRRTRARTHHPDQPELDFKPPAAQIRRSLKTTVEASIYCDAAVATPLHRAIAGAMDASMILIAFGLFAGVFHFLGGRFPLTKTSAAIFAVTFGALATFYSTIWFVAGAETPGMSWTGLRLINFDGFPPDGRSRAVRMLGCWLGMASAGLGMLWAMVDEEHLTWHDHMSKTFPTLEDSGTAFFRETRP